MLQVRTLQTLPELLALQAMWQQLVSVDSTASLCSTWEWTAAWIAQFWQDDFAPRVLVVAQQMTEQQIAEQSTAIGTAQVGAPLIGAPLIGTAQTGTAQTGTAKIVAILPLYLNTSTQELLLIGTGEPAACDVASEYLDLLFNEQAAALSEVLAALKPALAAISCRQMTWLNCLVSSRLMQLSSDYPRSLQRLTGCQYGIDLQQSLADLMQQFSYKQRKNGQLLLNRFNKSSEFTCDVLVHDADGSLWSALKNLHQTDWSARQKQGAFADGRFDEFHQKLAVAYALTRAHTLLTTANLPAVAPVYAVLRYQGEVVAIHYYLRWRERLYFYQSGTVKDRLQTHSPGKLLHMLALRQLAGSGLYYDFMKGGLDNSYKAAMCPRGPLFYTLRLYPLTLMGWLRWQAARIKQVLKQRLRK
jgi:hypothetical protein